MKASDQKRGKQSENRTTRRLQQNNMGMDNTTAAGPPGEDKAATYVRLTLVVLFCVICVVGTVGNGLVIYVTGFRMKKTVNTVWFLNLAIADFLFTVFMVFTTVSLSQEHKWPFGNVVCKIHSFVSIVNMFASIYFLTAISLDRCLSTRLVVWAKNQRTVTKAQLVCAFIWLVAIICTTPFTVYKKVLMHSGNSYCAYNKTEFPSWSMGMFRFTSGFFIPFVVIIICYVSIYCRAKELHVSKNRRCNRIIIAVILAFFFCWFPFHVIHLLELSKGLSKDARLVGSLARCLSTLNSCLNPILYVFMCNDFQKKLKESIYVVLESAFAEEHMTFMSSRSLSSPMHNISRKSETAETGKSLITSGTTRAKIGPEGLNPS